MNDGTVIAATVINMPPTNSDPCVISKKKMNKNETKSKKNKQHNHTQQQQRTRERSCHNVHQKTKNKTKKD